MRVLVRRGREDLDVLLARAQLVDVLRLVQVLVGAR